MNEELRHPSRARLRALVDKFAQQRLIVVGDLLADQFLYGEIARVSREAPVFILRHEHTETLPGGAANCAVNLAALGARVSLIGVVGDDAPGRELLHKLQTANVDCRRIVTSKHRGTTTKVRILAGQAHSTRQQVIRVDYEHAAIDDAAERALLHDYLREALTETDAAIISDYDYGVANAETAALVREGMKARSFPVTVDSRFHLTDFKHFTSATPNEDEVEQLLGHRLKDKDSLNAAARELRSRLECHALLITRGPNGMLLQETDTGPQHLAAVGAREPVDVTGAGDTVIAAYTLALAAGATFTEAAHLANHAGGLVVMKRGTASISNAELLSSIERLNG